MSKPTLHFLARDAIQELADAGVTVAPEDVLWLHNLAQKQAANSDLLSLSDWIELPVQCGKLSFRPLSIAAYFWVREYARDWFADDRPMECLAMAYALTHGREPEKLEALVTESATRDVLKKWARSLPFSFAALSQAVAAFMQHDESVEVAQATDKEREEFLQHYGFLIPLMERYYGGTREDWVYRKSLAEFREHADSLAEVMGVNHDERGNNYGQMRRHSEFRAVVNYLKQRRAAA